MLSSYFELLSNYTGLGITGILICACIVLLIILVLKRG